MSDEQKSIEELGQESDVAESIAQGKASITGQWAAFGIEPEVYVIEACGLPCVLTPWSNLRRMAAVRTSATLDPTEKALKLAEAIVTDCLFWIRGQTMPGRPGALKHASGLANLVGGRYMNLLTSIGGQMMDLIAREEQPTAGKKT